MKMKAMVIRESGGPEVLKMESIDVPDLGPEEVLVKVHACGVCRHDALVRNGAFKQLVSFPVIPGHEIAGEVAAVGKKVENFQLEDRVAVYPFHNLCGKCKYCRTGRDPSCPDAILLGDTGLTGGYAEYIVVNAYNLVPLPESVGMAEGAILSCAIGTSLVSVRDVGKVTLGDNVLVTGAAGGLGVHAVQLAKLCGGRVIAETIWKDAVDVLGSIGADEVILHKPDEDFASKVMDVTDGYGVDVVIDGVGSPTFRGVRHALALYGRWVFLGQVSSGFVQFSPAQIFLAGVNILSTRGHNKQHLEDVVRIVKEGRIKPIVSKKFPLENAREAQEAMEAGDTVGRIVITID